jgi:ADP-dependent NAD(P)H-hydrate dehydratase / NAD(P)H-hydrate epimerase
MLPVLTAAQMREADRRAIEGGVAGAVLMENAGAAVAHAVRRQFPGAARIAVLCGKGNNGGDGFVVARHLRDLGATAVLLGARGDVKGDARHHLEALEAAGGRLLEVADEAAWDAGRASVLEAMLVVDALLGTGLQDRPRGLTARVIADLVRWRRETGRPVVAVDVPSGLSSDSGETAWETVEANLTVTFAAPKYSHVLPAACDRVGRLEVADIGITAETVLAAGPTLWLLEEADAQRAWPPRRPDAHKGTFGHVLVVAGSLGKTGAAILASSAAMRAGAGLATVATPAPVLPLVAMGRPEVMTEPLPVGPSSGMQVGFVDRALELAGERQATVLGPGLGQEPGVRAFVRAFVSRRPARPLIIDADGLNALAPAKRERHTLEALKHPAATVLTPHPGEAARLLDWSTADVQARRLEAARELAGRTGAVVVLKGQRTLVARPDGVVAVNPTGNPGMATAGSGDVLSGMVGALLARGLEAWPAACAAVFAHGRAGDLAAERLGQESMLAGDILEALPEVLMTLAASSTPSPYVGRGGVGGR